jgi:toxin ParE1/3/4
MANDDRFRQAEEDLLSIAAFIAQDKPSAAARWFDEIEQMFVQPAHQPYMGEAVDHIRHGLRRVTHGKYLIFYEPRNSGILLVRVLHGSRKIEELFRP